LEDGRVEVIAEGKEDQVNQLIELIKKGPRFSKVHKVDVKFGDASGEFEGLEIRY
jgi:acylphosphatase